jgi:hypothetical protein
MAAAAVSLTPCPLKKFHILAELLFPVRVPVPPPMPPVPPAPTVIGVLPPPP